MWTFGKLVLYIICSNLSQRYVSPFLVLPSLSLWSVTLICYLGFLLISLVDFYLFLGSDSLYTCSRFQLAVDGRIVNNNISMFSKAFAMMFALYYVLNISYQAKAVATLEFTQRYILKNYESDKIVNFLAPATLLHVSGSYRNGLRTCASMFIYTFSRFLLWDSVAWWLVIRPSLTKWPSSFTYIYMAIMLVANGWSVDTIARFLCDNSW